MQSFSVKVSATAAVSTIVSVEAETEEEAKALALQKVVYGSKPNWYAFSERNYQAYIAE